MFAPTQTSGFPDTVYGPEGTRHRLASETADNIAWNRFAHRMESSAPFPAVTQNALTRITFLETSTPTPLAEAIARISEINEAEREGRSRGSSDSRRLSRSNDAGWRRGVVAVVGRGRRLAAEDHHDELKTIIQLGSATRGRAQAHVGADARKTLGDVGAAFAVAGPAEVSMLVMQATHDSTDV